MPRPTTVAYVAVAALDSALAASSRTAAHPVRAVTKSALMPLLALDIHVAAAGRSSGPLRGVRAAQGFSWLGDVALAGNGDRHFLLGLGSFFAAHVAYIAAFAAARDRPPALGEPGIRAGALTWAVAGLAMGMLVRRRDPQLALPVLAYAGILTAMLATSTALDRAILPSTRHRVLVGSALFVLSDTILGVGKFAGRGGHGPLDAAVMATYTAGQWLIADGVARAATAALPVE